MKKRIYNQTALFGPLYAYLVVLSPPLTVKDAVAKIKRELNAIADIGDRNLHSIAHITLFDKLTDDDDLANYVGELIGETKAFTLKINDWGFFDHGHSVTVFLKIENPEPVIDLAEALKSTARSPHISLAKKISYETFEKLVPYLESMNYTAEWECTEVNVLRKLMSEKHLGFKESIRLGLN